MRIPSISLLAIAGSLLAAQATAQHTGRLSRLLLDLYGEQGLIVESQARLPSGATHSAHFNSGFQTQFNLFNAALASQIAAVPIPSSASGFTYEFDAELGVFTRSTESFGPILAERAETIGRGKVAIGLTYQRFSFDSIGGIDLGAIPAVFSHDDAQPGGKADVVTTQNDIDATVNQVTTFATIGITDRLDLAIALPIVDTSISISSIATVRRIGTGANRAVHFFDDSGGGFGDDRTFAAAGSASGLGDVHLLLKQTIHKGDGLAVAGGVDLRLPSGEAENLLGTGAVGVRGFGALSSSHGPVSTHVNAGYQWNGDSILAGDLTTGEKGDLSDVFQYVAGVEIGAHEQVTLAFDLLGQVLFDTPRVSGRTFQALDGQTSFPDLTFDVASISQTSVAAGVKVNILSTLLLDLNGLWRIDDNGLKANFTPLVGVEYSW